MSKRKGKVSVTPPLPICQTCPWRIWCKDLNFRNMGPQGKPIKTCPIWWMLIVTLREKGILKGRPAGISTRPLSSKDAKDIMEQLRQQRIRKLGMPG